MMAMVSNWTKLNIYGVFMISVISVLLCRTVISSCQQGEVFDPNIKKCVDCTQICEFAPEDTLCSDCRKDGNAHTDWGKSRILLYTFIYVKVRNVKHFNSITL